MTKSTYKDTPIGKIPVDWEVKKLDSIGLFEKGKGVLKSDLDINGKYPCIRYGELYTIHHYVISKFNSFITEEIAKNSNKINKGDILFAGSGETAAEIGKCAVFNFNDVAYAGGDIIIFKPNIKMIKPLFGGYIMNSDIAIQQKRIMGQGNSVVHIYSSDLKKLIIPLPPLPEQHKIAEILSTWDKAIQETDSIIKSLEKRNKVLAYSLLTGRKRVQACESEGWKVFNLGFYIEEYRKKPNDNSDLPVFTSSKNGLMMQSDYYSGSRMLSREDVDYNILPNGFITYRSRSDDGLFTFNRNDKGLDGLISGYYPVFGITNGNADFFLYFLNYFKRKLTKYSSGTSQLVLSIKSLKTAKFNFPTHQEQSKIAEILNAANKELQQYQQKLNNLKTQKKGLMQQLLTGKVRTV